MIFTCAACLRTDQNIYNHYKHVASHFHLESFACFFCRKEYRTVALYRMHMYRYHMDDDITEDNAVRRHVTLAEAIPYNFDVEDVNAVELINQENEAEVENTLNLDMNEAEETETDTKGKLIKRYMKEWLSWISQPAVTQKLANEHIERSLQLNARFLHDLPMCTSKSEQLKLLNEVIDAVGTSHKRQNLLRSSYDLLSYNSYTYSTSFVGNVLKDHNGFTFSFEKIIQNVLRNTHIADALVFPEHFQNAEVLDSPFAAERLQNLYKVCFKLYHKILKNFSGNK